MLWYKSWIDTRSRFLIGLAVGLLGAIAYVAAFPQVRQYIELLATQPPPEGLPRIAESVALQRTFRGFVWGGWFSKNFGLFTVLIAALLGSGSALSGSGRGLLFSLALPVSRDRWVRARASLGAVELLALTLVPSLAICLVAPLVGEHYGVLDAAVHGVSAFAGAALFFAVATLLSTVFEDVWRPLLFTCLIAGVLAFAESVLLDGGGLFAVTSGEAYFRGGSPSWLGLAAALAVALALIYAAAANVARREF
jgi:hypothetical protein